MEKQFFLLKNKIQNYAWGTKNQAAFIPKLLNIKTEPDLAYAELWIGTHPKACSEILLDGQNTSLLEAINKYPDDILGNYCVSKFGKQFPYLLKVLSAAEALSIQAHPNKKYAEVLHKKDPVNYPDDNHKPEIAVALDNLTALAGFKDLSEILVMLAEYPEIKSFLGNPEFENQDISSPECKRAILKILFELLLKNAVESPENLVKCVESLKERIGSKTSALSEKEKLFLELASKNSSDDIGLLVVFFLELIHLNEGDGFFTGAGIPHAYIKGNIVECMANSDNVVRAGLTTKFKDIATLGEIAYYNTEPIEIIKDDKNQKSLLYNSPVEEFKLQKINFSEGEELEFNTQNSFEVILITEGELILESEGLANRFGSGSSVLIPALINNYKISSQNKSTIFRVTII